MELKEYKQLKALCEERSITQLSCVLNYEDSNRSFSISGLCFYDAEESVILMEQELVDVHSKNIYQMFKEYIIFANLEVFNCRANHQYKCHLKFEGNVITLNTVLPKTSYKEVKEKIQISDEQLEEFKTSLKDLFIKKVIYTVGFSLKSPQKEPSFNAVYYNSQDSITIIPNDRVEAYEKYINKLLNKNINELFGGKIPTFADFSLNYTLNFAKDDYQSGGKIPMAANSEITYSEDIFKRLNEIEKLARDAWEQAKKVTPRAGKEAEAKKLLSELEALFDPNFNYADTDFTTLQKKELV